MLIKFVFLDITLIRRICGIQEEKESCDILQIPAFSAKTITYIKKYRLQGSHQHSFYWLFTSRKKVFFASSEKKNSLLQSM